MNKDEARPLLINADDEDEADIEAAASSPARTAPTEPPETRPKADRIEEAERKAKKAADDEEQAKRVNPPSIANARKRAHHYSFFNNIYFCEYLFILVGMLASLVQGVVPLSFYYFFGRLVDFSDDHDAGEKIKTTSFYFFVIAAVAGVSGLLQTAVFTYCGERIAARIRRELFRAITMQDISFFDQTNSGLLITRLSEDSATIRDLFILKFGLLFVSLMQCGGGLGFAFYYSWKMTLVMLASAPLMGIAIGLHGWLTIRFTKQSSDASSNAVSVAEEVIGNFRTVRSFANEHHEVLRFCRRLRAIMSVANKKALLGGMSLGFTQACIWAAAALAFFYGGFLVEDHEITLGKVISIFGMMLFAVLGLSQALNVLPEVFKAKAAYTLISEIIDRAPDIPYDEGTTLPSINGQITFEGVTFKYPTRDVNVLEDIHLHIEAGQTVALVGESGSGKSTVFSLIERFYDPQQGRVLIDGVDVREFNPQWYHTHVALVSQEPILFSGTIAENIRYGKAHATDEEVEEAARAANAHDFIQNLPEGYQTLVGERGIALSGGQKQRVAIARAVLKDPAILLLDEATSALDTESEHLVQEALDKLMVGRTSLIIAHRLSTVRNADVIYVLHRGAVAEQGTHDELLEMSGIYRTLANRQLALSAAMEEGQ